MEEPTTTSAVLVTGGTGYLASWVVKELLADGYHVHATVRNFRDAPRLATLHALPGASERLTLFEANLLEDRSFDRAMRGCERVIHCASPFEISGIHDPQKQLVEPAVNGTRNVLGSVERTSSVRRVVLTSSVAAIYGDAQDLRVAGKKAFTEADWNTTSSLEHLPYSYSKTLAERAAQELSEKQTRWDLVIINPSFIFGPALDPKASGVSQTIMRRFADGTYKSGMADLWYGFVDARDVARAHILGAFSSTASGRYIVSGRSGSLLEVAAILRDAFGTRYPLPKRKAPKFILWLLPKMFDVTREYVTRNVGVPVDFDHRRSVEMLGVRYRPLETTVREHFEQVAATITE